MTSFFNVAYPANEDYIRFNGGKNNKIQKNLVLDNQVPDALNVEIIDDAIQTRRGSSKLNSASVGSFICDGLYTRHERNSTVETMCAWFNGSMFTLDAGNTFTTLPSAQSIYTAGTRVFAVEYQNHMFFGAGEANTPMKYNGTDFTRHGIYAPTASASVSTATTAGALSGLYNWAVTYVNSAAVESDISPIVGPLTLTSGIASLTSIPIAPQSYGVAARNIYRTEASGAAYYYVGQIGDNTTTTFLDEVADAALGDEAPSDQNVPPNYGPCLYHQSRLFVIGRYSSDQVDRVYYSDVGNPYVFGTLNFINIGDQTLDVPKALALWDNYLIVSGGRGTTWMVYMPSADDSTWVMLRVRSQYGSKSPLGVFEALNFLIFPMIERDKFVGFGALSAAGLEPTASVSEVGAIGSDFISNVVEPDMFDVDESELHNIVSIVYKNRAYIAYTTESGGLGYNDRMYVFDFSQKGLEKAQKYTWLPWSGMNASAFTVYDGKLYYGCSNDCGHIFQMLTDNYNDSGSAIDSYFWTKEFFGRKEHGKWHKDFRFANILYELTGAFDMHMTIRTDSDQGSGLNYSLDCSPGGSVWGTMIWGQDDWDAGRDVKDLKYPLGRFTGKRIQFKFSNQNVADQNFKIIGLNLTYNLKGKR